MRATNAAGTADSNTATATVTTPAYHHHPTGFHHHQEEHRHHSDGRGHRQPLLTYRWYRRNSTRSHQPIAGATCRQLHHSRGLTKDASYWVRVTNPAGTTDSSTAYVYILRSAPAITTQPVSVSINSGESTTLTVTASGPCPLSNGMRASGVTTNPVSGATGTSFTTPALTATTSYWVRATNSAGTANSVTATVTVTAKTLAGISLGNLAATYDGNPKSATANTTPAGLSVNFTYNGSATAPTSAGTYAVVGTINDTNYQGSATGSLVISKATATVTLGSLATIYNGSAKPATATTSPAGLSVNFTYNGSATAPTSAGTYTVVGTINDTNYQGSANGSLVISKATATVTLGSLAAIYNGSAKPATATTSPAGLSVNFTYDGSATAPTSAGTYAVVGTINDTNYQGSANGSLVISKATATVALGSLAATYNGSAKSATATTTPAGLSVNFTYDGSATAPTSAGTYAVVGTINDTNYQGSSNGSLVISKATATDLGSLAATYNGSAKSATATTMPDGLSVNFTYDGSATAPTSTGTYAVVGTINDTNYQGSATGSLVISKATATVTLGSLAATYDGNPNSAIATTTPLACR